MSPATDTGSTFIATARFRFVSMARYTSPIPPAPICAVIWSGPKRVPGVRATGGVIIRVRRERLADESNWRYRDGSTMSVKPGSYAFGLCLLSGRDANEQLDILGP